jgi:hypothetical protein
MKKLYTLSFILLSYLSFGQISDDFNYPDSALLTANGWTGFSGTGTQPVDVGVANGLSYSGYSGLTGFTAAIEGNAARLDNTGEDVQKTFTPITSGSIYYSFLINVDALNAATGYCIGLTTTGTTFGNKFFVRPSSTSGKINFGISNTTTANYSADFNPGTTYLIIIKYDVSATGSHSMWIKSSGVPATEAAAGVPDVTGSGSGSATIGGFFLRQHTASENLTIDGLRMYPTWFNTTACALTLGAEITSCDTSTLSLDTYSVTFPFTGGNTASYTLSTTNGTIGGDNPNTVASGNITITGITENTNITFTVSGGCDIVKNVLSPECKPINSLPYTEHFNYTAGNSLGAEQMWTNVNTGDPVLTVPGNLTYTGITPSGNSVSFSGAGFDPFTSFTSTTSGTVYYSFLMNITDITNVTTDLTETYFAGLTDSDKNYMARLFVKKNGTQYQLGFDNASITTNYDSTLRTVGDVVLVVMGYDFAANKLSAWFNPDLATFTAATAATLVNTPTAIANLGGFILRQDDAVKTPTITIDELKIATTTAGLLSVKQNSIAGLNIYPNPVSKGTLYITSNSNSAKSVSIFDVLGRQVLNAKASNNTVNVSNLKGGAYIVKITEEGKTATRKLIIE